MLEQALEGADGRHLPLTAKGFSVEAVSKVLLRGE